MEILEPGCDGGGHTNYYGFGNKSGNVLLVDVHSVILDVDLDTLINDNMGFGKFIDCCGDYEDERNTFNEGNSSVLHFNSASFLMDGDSGGDDYKDEGYRAYDFSSDEDLSL